MSNQLREFHGDIYYLFFFQFFLNSPIVTHRKPLTFPVTFTVLNDADLLECYQWYK